MPLCLVGKWALMTGTVEGPGSLEGLELVGRKQLLKVPEVGIDGIKDFGVRRTQVWPEQGWQVQAEHLQTWTQLCAWKGRPGGGRSITEQPCSAAWELSEGPGPRREKHTAVEGASKQCGSVGRRRGSGLSGPWVSVQTLWKNVGAINTKRNEKQEVMVEPPSEVV